MKKTLVLVFAALFVLSLASVSAASTIIAGTTYDGAQGIEFPITDADVVVSCNGYNVTDVSSSEDGTYSVAFDSEDCPLNSDVAVYATKGDLSGMQTGKVGSLNIPGFDCALNFEDVDVPMIPEFGLLVGGLTVIAAVTVFFVIRRN
jgi:hypothetical protein